MELRYCENCGEIIRLEGDVSPEALEIGFVCESCRAKQGEEAAGASGAETEACAGAEPEEEGAEPAATEAVEGGGGEAEGDSTTSMFSVEGLDLFSPDTVAARRSELETQTKTKIRLHDPEEAAEQEARTTAEGDEAEAPWERLAGEGAAKGPPEDPWAGMEGLAEEAGAAAGSAAPAATARRIQFRCSHCPAYLAIRPVETVSRLTCPRCGNGQFVSPDGTVASSLQELVAPAGGAWTAGGVPSPGPGEDLEDAVAALTSDETEEDLPNGLEDFLADAWTERVPAPEEAAGTGGVLARALVLTAALGLPVLAGVYLLAFGRGLEQQLEQIGAVIKQGLTAILGG